MRIIYVYKETGEDYVMHFMRGCSEKIREKFKFLIYRLLTECELPREPHIKHFTIEKYKAIYEMRIRIDNQIVRVMFSLYHGRDILLLHAFYKHSPQDGERGLEMAYKRYCRLGKEGYAEQADFSILGGASR